MENTLNPLPKVDIDSYSLLTSGLTPDMYLLLYWKYHETQYELPELLKVHYTGETLKYLEDKAYIKITGSTSFELRDKSIQIFNPNSYDAMFYELLSTFPMKVPSNNGTYRILRPKDPEANLNKEAKRKYFNVIKAKPSLHKAILKALHNELKVRKQASSLTYMQNFVTWLNQKSWELYMGFENDEPIEKTESL